MTYLLDFLKGPALATVAGFNEAEEDYNDAINALLNKYVLLKILDHLFLINLFSYFSIDLYIFLICSGSL